MKIRPMVAELLREDKDMKKRYTRSDFYCILYLLKQVTEMEQVRYMIDVVLIWRRVEVLNRRIDESSKTKPTTSVEKSQERR